MIRPALALALLSLATAAIADEPATQPSNSATDQARPDPDDAGALNVFFTQNFGKIGSLLRTDAVAAEKKISQLKEQIEAMSPTKQESKALVLRAKTALKYYESQVALARVTRAELEERLKANADDADALTKYAAKATQEIASQIGSDPGAARKQIASSREFLEGLKSTAKPSTRPTIDQAMARLSSLTSSLDAEQTREKLIGQKAAPLAVETWVNGSPLSDVDLKGKVVLLDFWAVWCGPCIATFPHLREWNEKYADKGLVILGITSYYNYDWDEKADRATRSQEKVAPEKEQAMLVKFAAQNKLAHRFGIQKASELSKFYGVTGIPQAVVIDREGIVRLIKVGSGEANAKAISEMLEKLIEPAKDAAD